MGKSDSFSARETLRRVWIFSLYIANRHPQTPPSHELYCKALSEVADTYKKAGLWSLLITNKPPVYSCPVQQAASERNQLSTTNDFWVALGKNLDKDCSRRKKEELTGSTMQSEPTRYSWCQKEINNDFSCFLLESLVTRFTWWKRKLILTLSLK